MVQRCETYDTVTQGIYKQRHPEKTVLYKIIAENLETYLAQVREETQDYDPVPQ